MTKAELIAQVAKQAKLSKTSAENAVNAITASITKCLKKKDKISLTGFGTFILTTRRPRKGRNPQTGESIMIGPSRLPRFKPGKQLREACR